MCEHKDVVEYDLGFGFLNLLLDMYIKYELKSMFEFRHDITKKILEEKKC